MPPDVVVVSALGVMVILTVSPFSKVVFEIRTVTEESDTLVTLAGGSVPVVGSSGDTIDFTVELELVGRELNEDVELP